MTMKATARRRGSIQEKTGRPNHRYAVITLPTGERVWHPVKRLSGESDTKLVQRAERVLSKLLEKSDKGIDIAPERITVEGLIERWLSDVVSKLEPRTRSSYEQLLRKHVIPVIGTKHLHTLRPLDVQAVYNGMSARIVGCNKCKVNLVSPAEKAYEDFLKQHAGHKINRRDAIYDRTLSGTSQLHCHRVLRKCLQWAYKLEIGGVTRNVADVVDAPRSDTAEKPRTSADELARILAASKEEPTYGIVVELAAYTGLRLGELIGLRWEDVALDAATPTLTVNESRGTDGGYRKPKTERSQRTIALAADAVAALDAHRKAQRAHYLANGIRPERDAVFTRADGDALRHDQVGRAWKRITTRAKVNMPDGTGIHSLRHAHASALLAAGIPVNTVSARLGHSQASTTLNIYGHGRDGADAEAAETMARIIRDA